MDDEGKMLFHGDDSSIEGKELVAEDEGGRDVADEIIREAEASPNSGFVEYCWDDPDVGGDEILDSDGDPILGKAPGDSLKISYVVNPFEYLGAPGLSSSPGIIFGSGIYPKMDNRLPECNGTGIAGDWEPSDQPDEPGEGDGDMGQPDDTGVNSVSGGGCAIASGGDGTPQSTAFNLLLLSSLFLAVSFRRRAVGRRKGIRF